MRRTETELRPSAESRSAGGWHLGPAFGWRWKGKLEVDGGPASAVWSFGSSGEAEGGGRPSQRIMTKDS